MSDLHDEIVAIVYKHLPGKHDQKRHGYRFGGPQKGYQTLEKLRKDGDVENTLDFLERIGKSGRIPYAAVRGEVGGPLSKREIGAIRKGLQSFRNARTRRGEKPGGFGDKQLEDFEKIVNAQGGK
jgi:hypothetical protein